MWLTKISKVKEYIDKQTKFMFVVDGTRFYGTIVSYTTDNPNVKTLYEKMHEKDEDGKVNSIKLLLDDEPDCKLHIPINQNTVYGVYKEE